MSTGDEKVNAEGPLRHGGGEINNEFELGEKRSGTGGAGGYEFAFPRLGGGGGMAAIEPVVDTGVIGGNANTCVP